MIAVYLYIANICQTCNMLREGEFTLNLYLSFESLLYWYNASPVVCVCNLIWLIDLNMLYGQMDGCGTILI